ncbi:retropepsin-like aspartic protease family protein [Agaribacter flavus]|uniref:TIGR02281 family clan AA aspartic protease n=1 Tax=Agaribacter flavus TaxID=1902781 RepID=A0ABV7FNQ1_9ALTE
MLKYILLGMLAASLCLNVLLFSQVQQTKDQSTTASLSPVFKPKTLDHHAELPSKNKVKTSNPHTQNNGLESKLENQDNSYTHTENTYSPEHPEKWEYLQLLRGQKRHGELLVAVREYLRAYPDSIQALLLEAETIFHTQALNVAIVHYYGLRELPLDESQRYEVDKFIEIHSNKIIQQFSNDENWALLATFLEPLFHIDPSNRHYILALAMAYGMDEHFGLMEDILASLSPNDPRAERLRAKIYQTEQQEQAPKLANKQPLPSLQDRFNKSELSSIRLRRRDAQYIAYARIAKATLSLLVDTGASITAISDTYLSAIENTGEFLGMFPVQTAGGKISSPMYKIPALYIENTRIDHVTVMVLNDKNLGDFDGLLGMNVLSRYNIVSDDNQGGMILRLNPE